MVPQAAQEAARDPSMVGDGVARLLKSRYDSISTYVHYCKRREENPMHVLEVTKQPSQSWEAAQCRVESKQTVELR